MPGFTLSRIFSQLSQVIGRNPDYRLPTLTEFGELGFEVSDSTVQNRHFF